MLLSSHKLAMDMAIFAKTAADKGAVQGEPAGLSKRSTLERHPEIVNLFMLRSLLDVIPKRFKSPRFVIHVCRNPTNCGEPFHLFYFEDGDLQFDGYLRNFQPGAIEEGSQPEATCVLVATNTDSALGDGTEVDPAYGAPV